MSEQQMKEAFDRARSDEQFSRQLFRDFEGALKANGYSLEPAEIASLKATFSPQQRSAPTPSAAGAAGQPQRPAAGSPSAVDMIVDTLREQQTQTRARAEANTIRMDQLANSTVEMFKTTLGYSARTYRMVTLMNQVMFWMGVSLFAFAAIYGAFTQNLIYTGIFCGLGAASFISLFFLGPIEKTQAALSNLIQAEIAFMGYFEQVTFAENYAQLPPPDSGRPSHESIEKASEMLQKRSKETIELLQIRVGGDLDKQAKTLAEAKAKAAATADKAPASATG
ncbi:MAG: hypothetical protein P4M04_08105 [Acidobacteriota bacterium]|nr:hypothetical protein [Acidobacteriota bacterium]